MPKFMTQVFQRFGIMIFGFIPQRSSGSDSNTTTTSPDLRKFVWKQFIGD